MWTEHVLDAITSLAAIVRYSTQADRRPRHTAGCATTAHSVGDGPRCDGHTFSDAREAPSLRDGPMRERRRPEAALELSVEG